MKFTLRNVHCQFDQHLVRRGNRRTQCWSIRSFALAACLTGAIAAGLIGCKQQGDKPVSDGALPTTDSIVNSNAPANVNNIGKASETTGGRGPANESKANAADPVQPQDENSIARISDFEPNTIFDRTEVIVDENGVEFAAGRLHKNSTLLVLAYQPDIRAEFVISTVRTILSPEQYVAAKELALSYDDQFQELARERAAVMETATDSNDVNRRVLKVDMKIAKLQQQIRVRINTDILTHEQRVESQKNYLEKVAERASREAAVAEGKAAFEEKLKQQKLKEQESGKKD